MISRRKFLASCIAAAVAPKLSLAKSVPTPTVVSLPEASAAAAFIIENKDKFDITIAGAGRSVILKYGQRLSMACGKDGHANPIGEPW